MKHAYLATAFGCLLAFGTPAVAQTLEIRSFGARCDGSDDSGAINAAFGALPNGGTLLLNCTLGIGPTGVLLHTKQGVTVDGSSGRIVGLANNNAKILIRAEACSGCTIRNLTIDANNVGAAGVSYYWSNNSSIENTTVVNIRAPAMAGIVSGGNQGNRYLNNTVSGTTQVGSEAPRGIWMGNPDSPLLERNPTIAGNAIRDIAATGLVLHTVGATVTGNTIERVQGSGMKLSIPPGQGGQTTIRQNTVRQCLWHGIQIAGVDSPVFVQNNQLSNNQNGLLAAEGGFVNSVVSGNTISGNGQGGVYIYDARNSSIESNQFTSNGNGIIFAAYPGSSLSGNRVTGNAVVGSNEDGIIVAGRGGSLQGLSVSSNQIVNNGRYGMSLEESYAGAITGVSLNGNCFSGNRVGALLDYRVNPIGGISQSGGCSGTVSTQAGATSSGSTTTTTTSTSSGSTSGGTSTSTSTSQSTAGLPIRINAGAGSYTAPNGEVWAADYGFSGGEPYDSGRAISNTNTPDLYRTHHWIIGTLDYNISVPTGSRTVVLKFAETYVNGAGQRIFDVYLNGQPVLPNFDVAAACGVNNACDRSFNVQSSGQISIRMVGKVQNPMISAIEIR